MSRINVAKRTWRLEDSNKRKSKYRCTLDHGREDAKARKLAST